ncbi:hypothetical protein [Ahrensia marina]|uniref:Uncharacterized protein n=1 Tax=Ahrensia marina TaxID=1514904 RepID=A0A0N0E6E3_9HYPH|nr:hypothetical protein [Ahrensia marina]KPA99924.1 hypothetical protein SU32_16475 [Ahrensia marina]
MNDVSEDAIDSEKIISELQASFDNDRYHFRDVEFVEGSDRQEQMELWRKEMADCWRLLIQHTMEVWDYGWHHSIDFSCKKRAEWLFRRKESPFLNCSVEQCRRVTMDMLPTAPREPEQFLLFTLAVLTQGST